MNPPELKNVTPPAVGAPPPSVSGPPVAKAPPSVRNMAIGAVIALVILFGGYKLLHHHNHYEATADAVTQAIQNNDMTPVLHAFNAVDRSELQDRARVGNLSNLMVPLGAFKGSKEITPTGLAADHHEFTETFEKGTLDEKFVLDSDGKIVHFHIGPPPSTP